MNFRTQNIRPGHCEVWANTEVHGRYQPLATVTRDGDGMWSWSAKANEPPFYMPDLEYKYTTRLEAVRDCERRALRSLVDRAIESQPEETSHWHSPRRDAWNAVSTSYLFSWDEYREIHKRLLTFAEGGQSSD